MEKEVFMKAVIRISFILLLSLCFLGCGLTGKEQKDNTEQKKEQADKTEKDNPEENKQEENKEEEKEEVLPEKMEITYFHGDDNVEYFIEEKEEIEMLAKDLNAQMLIDLLAEKGVIPDTIEVNSFKKEGTLIKLDLSIEFEQYVQTMGTAGEGITIGSLVNTFLSNYEADGLELKIDGRDMETGHNIYDYVLEKYE